jgi:squalene-hopene/tetraprenyl-beta-curcumene cyclase
VKNASDVGITAFVVYALAKHPKRYRPEDGPFLSKAVDFLLSRQQEDGGIYDPADPALQNYRTSVAILALTTLDRVKYAAAIRRAQAFVKDQQVTEADGYDEKAHLGFGSVGYGSGLRGDLSNTQLAAEALAESGVSGADEVWRRMVVYVARCQNAESVDPLLQGLGIGTTRDGGYRYAPNETRGPTETLDDGTKVFSSYGSMTYAALKTLLYAQVDRKDPKVAQAFDWISKNFTVKENPGMASRVNPKAGLQGLFYYYHTMAKTLSLYGEPVIRDAKGVEHVWAKELASHLVSIQKKDGAWQNASDRWWENIEALDTAYAMVALVDCQEALAKGAGSPAPAPPPAPAADPKPAGSK